MSRQAKLQKQAEYHPHSLIFIQSRAGINIAIVEEYAEMMADGVVFDAIEGVQDENGNTWIYDGYHRGEAAKSISATLRVNLRPGNRTEAEWLALTANQKHGLRRTTKDKQHVIRQALLHPYGVNLSNSELARHCGVSDKTVAKIRRELELSSEIPKIDHRIVRRNGVTYEQNVGNIGNGQRDQPADKLQSVITPMSPQPRLSLSQCHHDKATPDELLSPDRTQQVCEDGRSTISSGVAELSPYQVRSQEFECPRCGTERIVGVNGSRRWCLNCAAEWPTAALFLAEVNGLGDRKVEHPTRQQLQNRFLNILAQLDDQDVRLSQINTWLDALDAQLELVETTGDPVKMMLPIPLMPVSAHA